MDRFPARWAPATATACALSYVGSKVHLALAGEIGIIGFYVRPEVNEAFNNPAVAQWWNATIGVIVASLCLALAWPTRSRSLRLAIHIASWLGVALIATGLLGFTLRAFGITSSPDWQRTSWVSYVTLAIGWLWVVAWMVAIVRHRRLSTEAPPPSGAAAD
jgi:MprA protease rhombosortase-interaction domain-containing protein